MNTTTTIAGGDGGGGALDRLEQTAVARMVLCSAKMAAGEAATGRRKAGGTLLGKEAKQVGGTNTRFFHFVHRPAQAICRPRLFGRLGGARGMYRGM